MPDETQHGAFVSFAPSPNITTTPLDGQMQHVKCSTTALVNGMWTEITAAIVTPAGADLQPRITVADGAATLDLLNADGDVVASTTHWPQPRPVEPEPWPRTHTVPPGVWTELPGGAGTVLNETDATTTVTVGEDGEVTFSGPMRWRPADAQEEYDGWGEDA